MKHIMLLLTLTLAMLGSATAALASDVIAVLDFKSLMADEELGIAVAEILRTELANLGDYTIIERGALEQILEEQALQSSGAIDTETAAEIGKLLGAKLVVSGSIVKTGDVYTINSRFIDVETGVIKTGQNIRGEGDNEISNMVHQLALVITGRTIVAEEVLATATPQAIASEMTAPPQPQGNPPPAPALPPLLLFSFEDEESGKVWKKSSRGIKVTRAQEHASEGTYAAQIVFPQSRGEQAVGMNQTTTDWSAYAALEFDAYWDAPTADQRPTFNLAVEDAQTLQGQGFDREFELNPGQNKVWFALAEIRQRVDLTHVARLAIALRSSEAPITIYLDRIQLSPVPPQPPQPGAEAQPPAPQPGQQSDGRFPALQPEALTACDNKAVGDPCEFVTLQGTIYGTCQQRLLDQQQLGCLPAGRPLQREPGSQVRPPRR